MVGPVELKEGGVSLILMPKLCKTEISCQETNPRPPNPARTVMGQSQPSRGDRRESELVAIGTFPWLVGACGSFVLLGVGRDAFPCDALVAARQERQRTDQSGPDDRAGFAYFEFE